VKTGDFLGVSSENAALNLVGFDEDSTQRSLFRLRQFIHGSTVFADMPRVGNVVDDFSDDAATTRFSVAVQIVTDSFITASSTTAATTTAAATTAAIATTMTAIPSEHRVLGTNSEHCGLNGVFRNLRRWVRGYISGVHVQKCSHFIMKLFDIKYHYKIFYIPNGGRCARAPLGSPLNTAWQ